MVNESHDEESRQLLADARAVRAQVFDTLQRYEDSVWAAGYRQGRVDTWREAWDAGYDYAMKAVEAAMRRQQQQGPRPTPTPAPEATQTPPPSMETGQLKLTANEIVLQIIRNNPGLLGIEIIGRAQKLQEPLKERTVRTALHRLKDDKIENRDRRWYPIAVEASA